MRVGNDDKMMLKPREAARALRIGANKIYEELRANRIPHIRIGRNILIPKNALEAWIEAQLSQSA